MKAKARTIRGYIGAGLLLIICLYITINFLSRAFSQPAYYFAEFLGALLGSVLSIIYISALAGNKLQVSRIAFYTLLIIWFMEMAWFFMSPIIIGKGFSSSEIVYRLLMAEFIIFILPFGSIMYLMGQGVAGIKQMEDQFMKTYLSQKENITKPEQENEPNE
jgi:hypothetical protein